MNGIDRSVGLLESCAALIGDEQAFELTRAGTRWQIDVGAGSFRTGVALRNQHLRNEMEVDRYPLRAFRVGGRHAGAGRACSC